MLLGTIHTSMQIILVICPSNDIYWTLLELGKALVFEHHLLQIKKKKKKNVLHMFFVLGKIFI